MSLFPEKISLDLPNSNIVYIPNFLTDDQANHLFKSLRDTVPWQSDDIRVFGKTYAQPRLTALYGNDGKTYSYSNITMVPNKFTPELATLKTQVEKEAGTKFTTCLLNLYRNGKDSNGWHADDEKELGKNPIIASVSLGAERFFHLRNKENKALKYKLSLEHGSLLVMRGETQHCWQHQIPKTSKKIGERINLTFRILK